jgi:hypothetical protein
MKFKSELKRWDPVTGLVRVSLVGCKVLLILVSLGIVMRQGYDVTQTYLRKPMSTEVKVVPLSSVPNLSLSICMRFEIKNCTFFKPGTTCGVQKLTPFQNNLSSNYQHFWNYTNLNITYSSMRNILDQIQYWNDSGAKWETIFDNSTTTIGDEMTMFTKQMYPYLDNYTLLCHTLNQDVVTLAPMLQLKRKGKNNCNIFTCTYKQIQEDLYF